MNRTFFAISTFRNIRLGTYCRPFPQGTIMQLHEKSFHGDGNGATIPGLWQCVQEDPNNPVTLSFTTSTITWNMVSSTGRCTIFKGLAPHATRLINPPLVASKHQRMSHSSYWKLYHEYIALVLMSPENYRNLKTK